MTDISRMRSSGFNIIIEALKMAGATAIISSPVAMAKIPGRFLGACKVAGELANGTVGKSSH
ncbi:hypothetical protein C4J81_14140 [Deltaproteobacteria bacterium Smac51]|nr:hypothetical protein C4J81_14140 [Deltaproteobacteria bacterium Smac51]